MSPESTLPLISCIMPTYNRREFVPHAIRYFLRQDYPNKELIVIDDGEDAVADLIPLRDDIHYYRLNNKLTLGAKLNMACEYARGTFIAHWDDDDWYAPRRLQYQVRELQNGGTSLCGINHLLYFDLIRHHALQYVYPANQRVWLIGSSLFYHKDLWAPRRFADINVGMDGLFVWAVPRDRITVLEDPTISVHMIHDRNVSPKKTGGSWWHAYPVDEIQKILQADWPCYVHDGFSAEVQPAGYPLPPLKPAPPLAQKNIRNIYACLVHEHEECIIDLVRNLHYHDPSSVILLYNGGSQPDLKGPDFPYGQFGAIWVPHPVTAKWGYLHQFALDCMAFALEHLSFDILTIVDSDQLCLRTGYTAYMSGWITAPSTIGMLSNMPERVTRENLQVHPAIQAWREFELWKPLLQQFPGGEDRFVHWTFWPSTVFTADAARDLVKLFRENALLQGIMQQTKIWATEEIILPTLVRLLGYDIAANPCSYDFVKYKKVYSLPDLRYSMDKSDAYWIHPIERNYNNPLRHHIRHSCHHYQKPKETPVTLDLYTPELLLPLAVMNKVKSIEGWLSDAEAELLLAVAIKACESLSAPLTLVEIGSYQGKSTVLLGSVAKSCSREAKVYAIDPHEGKVGATDQGLHALKPTYDIFQNNMRQAGLSGVVETIREYSYQVKWEKPVSLLFIDGLHDYPNVARDFGHFSGWVQQGGYIVFHDYADYYPGVLALVNEVLQNGDYRKVRQADSLIVVQKK